MSLFEAHSRYARGTLGEHEVDRDPLRQARRWLDEAHAAGAEEPTAATLATVDGAGRPSARMVLLRGIDDRGCVLYTSYASRKARELAANPWAALVLWWPRLERQVRIEGRAEAIAPAESDAYFSSRPRESQLGAWASPQSAVIQDRAWLEERLRAMTARFEKGPVPRPPDWGGYRVLPDMVELWQGRPHRLHDRIRYRRADPERESWTIERLAP